MIDETITPTNPAHWLAENLESETPTPVLPPTAIAAANGSLAEETSKPYLRAFSETFAAIPNAFFFMPLMLSTLFFMSTPKKGYIPVFKTYNYLHL